MGKKKSKKKNSTLAGMKKMFKPVTGGINKLGGSMKNVGDKMAGKMKSVGNKMAGQLKSVGGKMLSGFKKVGDEFKKISDIFTCIGNIFKSLFSYFGCGFKMLKNFFTTCWYYYIIDCIYYLARNIVWGLVSILQYMLGAVVSLKDFVWIPDMVYDALVQVDDMVHDATNVHFMRYSDATMEACYKCDVKPLPSFSSLGKCKAGGGDSSTKKKKPVLYVDCEDSKKTAESEFW